MGAVNNKMQPLVKLRGWGWSEQGIGDGFLEGQIDLIADALENGLHVAWGEEGPDFAVGPHLGGVTFPAGPLAGSWVLSALRAHL